MTTGGFAPSTGRDEMNCRDLMHDLNIKTNKAESELITGKIKDEEALEMVVEACKKFVTDNSKEK